MPTPRVGSFGPFHARRRPRRHALRAPEPEPAAIIRAVIPLFVVAAGAIALLVGVVILRSLGSRFRVGRLLASTPRVSVAEA